MKLLILSLHSNLLLILSNMNFIALILDVEHNEGEDNLLYVSPNDGGLEKNFILTLRGVLAASAGATRTLFQECLSTISFHPDIQAAYVDNGDKLFVLAYEGALKEEWSFYLQGCADNTWKFLINAFGPPGQKLHNWRNREDEMNSILSKTFAKYTSGVFGVIT